MVKESAPMATLILEDGTRYEGTLFGHKAPVTERSSSRPA